MVDLQSFLWTARLATRGAQRKIAKPPVEYSQEQTAETQTYSLEQCKTDLSVDRDTLCDWLDAIERKGQAIFYGPPGTGKTFAARALARYLSQGEYSQSSTFWEMVQFHPAYAYEDFVQGLRPRITEDNSSPEFVMMPGRFVEFCRRAQNCKGCCVLIIDEINRADVAQVFGELLFLLEYRDREIPLAGGGTFFIPANVRIIGTMNTANRSVATLDAALRRRFAFLQLLPNYEILRRFHQDSQFNVEGLIQIPNIWRFEIEPYLEETFFNRPQLVEQFQWDKVKSVAMS
jgi:5-methylcytosine-specific restriction protein B